MQAVITEAATTVIKALIPVVVALFIEWMRRKLGVEKIRRIQEELLTKQELAFLAVQFAQQAYRDFDGPQKYERAAQWMATQAEKAGFKVTPGEVKGLIEAALRQMKDEFGEEWGKIVILE